MSNEFIKADLHIHTPASKCYKGKDTDNEYLNLLRKAHDLNINIIAITDHNSIEGYKRIVKIKSTLIEKKRLIHSNISPNDKIHPDIEMLNKELELFDNLLILPGVEFETKNGVHLLVVFDDHTPIELISKFIEDGGYDCAQYGLESPSILPKWDILDLFAESKKYDCIVIDAHTDSNKGIYNTIPSGTYRANCFKSSQLSGVCFKSEKQKNQLAQTISQAKEYQRKSTLAFLKFSDAHCANELGRNVSWFKVEDHSFQSLRCAFDNSPESITTEPPKTSEILNKLINDKAIDTFGLPNLRKRNKERFKRLLCALNNSKGGYILLGMDEEKNKNGLDLSEAKARKEYPEEIRKCFRESVRITNPLSYQIYPLQSDKCIITVHVKQSDDLIGINNDGKIYLIEKSKVVAATAKQIQDIVEERVTVRVNKNISKKIAIVESQCSIIKNYFSSIPIIKMFERRSMPLRRIIAKPTLLESKKIKNDGLSQINKIIGKNPNGTKDGNLLYLKSKTSPRLSHAYLRMSPVRVSIKPIKHKKTETIYVVPGGAVFYCNELLKVYTDNQFVILTFSPINHKLYSAKLISAFLKSSFFLWYCINKFDSMDTFRPVIFKNILLPDIDASPSNKTLVKSIEVLVDEILAIESKFLMIKEASDKDIEAHNSLADEIFRKIDENIYSLIGLSQADIGIVEECLIGNNIYLSKK